MLVIMHQHGVSIENSIKLCKKFLRMISLKEQLLCSVFSQIVDLIYWTYGFEFFLSILNGVTLKISNMYNKAF